MVAIPPAEPNGAIGPNGAYGNVTKWSSRCVGSVAPSAQPPGNFRTVIVG